MPAYPDASLVGATLDGAYQLTRLIFEGGMGTVYEAEHFRLHKRVAVKVMVPDLAESPEGLARFNREVEVTSQLAHPHVIQLLDFGVTPSHQPYLVMEYLDGEDLEQRLRRVGRLPLPTVVSIVRQVSSALAMIHARGIVHRDLKPANIFLLSLDGSYDFAKVVDFGISKVQGAKTKLTQAFTMVGTPESMSPEQATGRVDEIDHRCDQWALACVAWRMLSGTRPFEGDTLKDLLHQVVNEDPPSLAAQVPDLPPAIEAVLRRALAKPLDDRFPTISAFWRAFEAAAAAPVVAPVPVPVAPALPVSAQATVIARPALVEAPARPRRRGGWVVAVLTALCLAAGGALFYRADGAALLRDLYEHQLGGHPTP